MFALVEFIENSSIAVVPLCWLNDRYCYWPNTKDVVKFVKAQISPKSNWTQHSVEVKSVYSNVYFFYYFTTIV